MAERALAVNDKAVPNCLLLSWTGLLNGDTGRPAEWPQFNDKTVQVVGTFGTGGSINIEGSNDGTNWGILTDPQGNALTITATKLEAIAECPRFIRPNVTAGDGTTSLSVIIQATKGSR